MLSLNLKPYYYSVPLNDHPLLTLQIALLCVVTAHKSTKLYFIPQ